VTLSSVLYDAHKKIGFSDSLAFHMRPYEPDRPLLVDVHMPSTRNTHHFLETARTMTFWT